MRRRAETISDYFVERDAKAIVVACNTATAAAIADLRARHPGLIVIGVEPAIKPAAHLTASGVIGVFATTGTLASRKFAALVQREAPEVRILLRPCPSGSPWSSAASWKARPARRRRSPGARAARGRRRRAGAGLHPFPFLDAAIRAVAGPSVPLLETGAPVARWLRHQLQERDLQADGGCGALELETTGDPATLARLAGLLLGGDFQAAQTPPAWR